MGYNEGEANCSKIQIRALAKNGGLVQIGGKCAENEKFKIGDIAGAKNAGKFPDVF